MQEHIVLLMFSCYNIKQVENKSNHYRENNMRLTRKQKEVYDYLLNNIHSFSHPPTLEELCQALGLKSRGSLYKHIKALIENNLIEPLSHKKTGIVLSEYSRLQESGFPIMGKIAAGQPIEAIENPEYIDLPPMISTDSSNYVLKVQGDSMIDVGIMDGDWVVIESRNQAQNGEIVVALIDQNEATLKRLEHKNNITILHPENKDLEAMKFESHRVQIQGVLVGQMRSYT